MTDGTHEEDPILTKDEIEEALSKRKTKFMRITIDAPIILPFVEGVQLLESLKNAEMTADNGWRDNEFKKVVPIESSTIVSTIITEDKYIEAATYALLNP